MRRKDNPLVRMVGERDISIAGKNLTSPWIEFEAWPCLEPLRKGSAANPGQAALDYEEK